MMLFHQNAFIFDLQFILSRTNNNLGKQIIFLFINIYELITNDKWIIFGLLGFFLYQNKSFGFYSFFFFLTSFIYSARHAPMTGLSYYYFIPYFSLIIIGISGFFTFFFEKIRNSVEEFFNQIINKYEPWLFKKNNPKSIGYVERLLSAVLLSIFIAPTLIFSLHQTIQDLINEFPTPMSSFMVDYSEAKVAAEFVNHQVNSDDLVVASPAIAWMIETNRVDFQIPIIYEGNPSIHLPANIPADRFSYNSDYRSAKFVIVDNIWTDYAIHDNIYIREMFEDIEKWPLVWFGDQVRVYMNNNIN